MESKRLDTREEVPRTRIEEPCEDFYPDDVADEVAQLRDLLEAWAESAVEALTLARPARIDGLRDRTNEVWRPLLAIAELAGAAWPDAARRSAVVLAAGENDEPSLGVLLLGDIREVFKARKAERIATSDLILALAKFSESPWAEWWLDPKGELPVRGAPRRLAQLLRPYGIRTNQTVRVGKEDASRLQARGLR